MQNRVEVMGERAVAPAPLMVRRTFLLLPDLIPHFSSLFAESLGRYPLPPFPPLIVGWA